MKAKMIFKLWCAATAVQTAATILGYEILKRCITKS